jgi:hypothetical protein
MNNGEDQVFAERLRRGGVESVDPIRQLGEKPFYVYSWGHTGGWHLSGLGPDGYRRLGRRPVEKARLVIADPPELDLRNPEILPEINPRRF